MNYKDLALKNESWIRSGWGSLESQSNRHKLINSELMKYKKFKTILDFGCNDCSFFYNYLNSYRNVQLVLGYDPCKEALENAAKKNKFNKNSFEFILYDNYFRILEKYKSYFEIIICCGVLQISKINKKSTIKQIKNLLRKEGIAFISLLSLDWEGFKDNPLKNKPNNQNQWSYYKEIELIIKEIKELRILKALSINPRTGDHGPIGYGYDMLIILQKIL